ncbi:eukaryotic translation initiation factor 2D [Carabus blaptoides fortunei]
MFLKPFRVKSNSQMKNSERKALKNTVLKKFSSLADNDVEQIFSNKESIAVVKLITYANNTVVTYLVKKRPMLFEYDGELYPTIYFLWHFPDLLPCFTTHPQVVSNLTRGADLMLPGVVLPDCDGPAKYGRFEKGTLYSINITNNKAPVAIGTTAHSSMDMYMCAGRGRCVNVLHSLCDQLCQMEGNVLPTVPTLGPPTWLLPEISNDEDSTEIENEIVGETIAETLEKTEISDMCDTISEMDELLKLHMITACPVGKNLDIKKSSYKKLNKFLSEMVKEGVLKISEQTKGVESITSINFEHLLVTTFLKDRDDVKEIQLDSDGKKLDITETYTVTASVLPLFATVGLRKGDTMKPADVRKHVTEYVRNKKLQSLDSRNTVIPNKELAGVIKTDEPLSWEELMQKIFSSMTNSYTINHTSAQVMGKGKVEPIVITVASRSGNKKVTLVDNLELYGIHTAEFSKECQHGVAASTTVTKPVGKKYDQLLIQGNQVAFVGNLLIGKYNIPKRYIRGLELAVKNKK